MRGTREQWRNDQKLLSFFWGGAEEEKNPHHHHSLMLRRPWERFFKVGGGGYSINDQVEAQGCYALNNDQMIIHGAAPPPLHQYASMREHSE